jgi:hypothetical protein
MTFAIPVPRCIMLGFVRNLVLLLAAILAGCSSGADAPTKAKQTGAPMAVASVIDKKNPLAKYLEVGGFRVTEGGAGKLTVKFAVINHSDADIGDLTMKVTLTTTAAKPEDAPIAVFDAKVPSIGPQEVKDAVGTATTKLRVYELPDWQFLRADVEITSPAP